MAKTQPDTLLHATCVSWSGRGVLLLGKSGSGKSDLALRLIDEGATLVADDQAVICAYRNQLLATAAPNIGGLIEARGIGILQMTHAQDVPIALAIELVGRNQVERMPESAFFDCLGLQVPLVSLHAFDTSTPAKIKFLMRSL